MKKLACILLILTLFLPCISIAKATEDFTFKENIHFGDSIDEVKAKDPDFANTDITNSDFYQYRLRNSNITFMRQYNVGLFYYFDDEKKLKEISYYSNNLGYKMSTSDVNDLFNYLGEAITTKYGEPLAKNDIRRSVIASEATKNDIPIKESRKVILYGIEIIYKAVEHEAWLIKYDDYYVKIDLGYTLDENNNSTVNLTYYYVPKDEYDSLLKDYSDFADDYANELNNSI